MENEKFKDSKENRIHKAGFIINTLLKFKYLEPEFNNIDEVYTNNLNVWYCYNSDHKESKDGTGIEITNGILKNPNNFIFSKTQQGFKLSEVDFIDAELKQFDFLETDKLTLVEQKQFRFYRQYLGKKRNHIEWNLNDHFNNYLVTKNFGFSFLRTYKKNQYKELTGQITTYKERYFYIFERLNDVDKIELKNDFCDKLKRLINYQIESKFKEVLTNLIENINDNYLKYKTENTDEVKGEYFYCQIGALFAQGFIKRETNKGIGATYFYKEKSFESINKLANHIKKEVLKTRRAVRQYIDATLSGNNNTKDFYKNKNLNENTISYCKTNNIKIVEDFKL